MVVATAPVQPLASILHEPRSNAQERTETAMKKGVFGVAILASTLFAAPALAHVVEITTALDVTPNDDATALKQALRAAVDKIRRETVAFQPTLVALTYAQMVGERLYVRVLVADEDGEQLLKDVRPEGPAPSDDRSGEIQT